MAEEVLGRTVKKLKQERTTAKSSFTRQANFILRGGDSMSQEELKEEFTKFDFRFRKLVEANDDYRVGLEADIKEADPGGALDVQDEADIDSAVKEAVTKQQEVRDFVKNNLWSRYGKIELQMPILEAERTHDQANNVPVTSDNLEAFDVLLTLLDRRVNEAKSALFIWEKWIPMDLKDEMTGRTKELIESDGLLQRRKSDFAKARQADQGTGLALPHPVTPPIIKIKPTTLPIFNGSKRDYHRWKKDWESLQRQGEPSGSPEVKKIQLLDSVDDIISKQLRLSTYTSATEMFRVLDNRFGNNSTITLEILEELEKMPPVKGNQPRKVIELIQCVEKALADLTELGNSGAIKNPLVIKSIESKLPDFIQRDWVIFMVEPNNNVKPDNHFDMLLTFLKNQEDVLERLEQLRVEDKMEKPDRSDKYGRKYGSTRTTNKEGPDVCDVCGEGGHTNKVYFCRRFRRLPLPEKRAALERIGACNKCLTCHVDDGDCTDGDFLCRNADCKRSHHYLLCPKGVKRPDERKGRRDRKSTLTEEQEQFLSELSPEMSARCKKAFTNKISVTLDNAGQSELLRRNGLSEIPVIMMLQHVTANAGQKIGTLIDLASDTNYITHKAARRLRLRSEKITLVVHGVGGMTMRVKTKRYLLKVRVKTLKGTERAHKLVCYGLDEIAKVHQDIKPEKLHTFFPEVKMEELKRPKEVELLISHREGRLAPQRIKIIEDLVLWEGPLGKTIGGAHPDLVEDVEVAAYKSRTHFARSMRAAAVQSGRKVTETKVPAHASQNVNKLKKKAAITVALTAERSQKDLLLATQEKDAQRQEVKLTPTLARRKGCVKGLKACSLFKCLLKMVTVIAWVCWAATQWLKKRSHVPKRLKWEATAPRLTGEELGDKAAKYGTTDCECQYADCPWRNGAAEAAVSMKKQVWWETSDDGKLPTTGKRTKGLKAQTPKPGHNTGKHVKDLCDLSGLETQKVKWEV